MSDELLNEFIFDSREHLSTAGAQLLELEKKNDSLPVINALMGTLHTIKGTSGFFDLKHLYELLNKAESLLQTVREKEKHCPPKIVDLLLQVLDTVEAILDRLESGADDQVEWIGTLTQALSEADKDLDKSPLQAAVAAAKIGGNSGATARDGLQTASGPRPAAGPSAAALPDEECNGRISLMTVKNGQLADEGENFTARVDHMFEAGLKGLVVDLRSLASVSGVELKALMAAARKFPEKTAFLLDKDGQQSLDRVFKVLNLDAFMKFFPDENQAVEFIKASAS